MAGVKGVSGNLNGRPAGVPNKATGSVRQTIAVMAEKLAPELIGWIRDIAVDDKAKAVDLYLKAIEYHIPKIQRVTLVGDDDAPIHVRTTSLPDSLRQSINQAVDNDI